MIKQSMKRPMSGGLRALTLCALLVVAFAGAAKADEVYTYTGAPFTVFDGLSCPSVCSISGSFTLPSAIGPSQTVLNITPLSFSFTDGATTFNSSNSVFQDVGFVTDAAGNISLWLFGTFGNSGLSLISANLGPGQAGDLGANNNHFAATCAPGSWKAVATPEPSALLLLSAGLVGLLGLRKRPRVMRLVN